MDNINTNTRLFDLVRYMRAELHDADLITDAEYAWLTAEADNAKTPLGGSPSPRRLEDYDEIKARLDELEEDHAAINAERAETRTLREAWIKADDEKQRWRRGYDSSTVEINALKEALQDVLAYHERGMIALKLDPSFCPEHVRARKLLNKEEGYA